MKKIHRSRKLLLSLLFLVGLNLGVLAGWVAAQLSPGQILILDDFLEPIIVAVNPVNGSRELFSSNSLGTGPVIIESSEEMALAADGSILVLGSDSSRHTSLFRIDPVTKERKLVSDFSNPTQGPTTRAFAFAVSSASDVIVLSSDIVAVAYLYTVNLNTGMRTLLSTEPIDVPDFINDFRDIVVTPSNTVLLLNTEGSQNRTGSIWSFKSENPMDTQWERVIDFGDATGGPLLDVSSFVPRGLALSPDGTVFVRAHEKEAPFHEGIAVVNMSSRTWSFIDLQIPPPNFLSGIFSPTADNQLLFIWSALGSDRLSNFNLNNRSQTVISDLSNSLLGPVVQTPNAMVVVPETSPPPPPDCTAERVAQGDDFCCADTDNDALCDDWEINGYDDNGIHVDLPGMGARYDREDIFVEIDYMVGITHTHRPRPLAINKVIAAFAKHNIALHVDYGQGGAFTEGGPIRLTRPLLALNPNNTLHHMDILPGLAGRPENADLGKAFLPLKRKNFNKARAKSFHYCIFAHQIDKKGTSGIGTILGSDFVVSLGTFVGQRGDRIEQAGTFMHELGHNLGLNHGGATKDKRNFKPNYLSVMNYFFQTNGLRVGLHPDVINYSPFALRPLNEKSLNEKVGIGAAARKYSTYYYCPWGKVNVQNANDPINWDCDPAGKLETKVRADINNDRGNNILWGHDDWGSLQFKVGTIGRTSERSDSDLFMAQEEAPTLQPEEPSFEELTSIPPYPPPRVIQVPLTMDKVQVKWIPLGREAIQFYNIYREEPGGRLVRVKQVKSSPAKEDRDELSATLPAGYRYLVTAVTVYGVESPPAGPELGQ